MDTGPKGAFTALEILENRDIFEPSLLTKWSNPVVGSALALASSLGRNYFQKRPIMSGVQHHVLWTVGAFFFIKYLDEKLEHRHAVRDAALREYVRLHPEDFPPIERVKIKDILETWYPIRT